MQRRFSRVVILALAASTGWAQAQGPQGLRAPAFPVVRSSARGGKLIQYHGWSDLQPPPLNTVNYFNRVQATMERRTTK
jgi:hypothetical protein